MYSLSFFFAGEKNSCVYYIQNEIKITLHIKRTVRSSVITFHCCNLFCISNFLCGMDCHSGLLTIQKSPEEMGAQKSKENKSTL